ncbi:pentapeptide repeat-containing protein [Streptomyces sp. NPDC048518]|uniref:pentapeptide repeat-containing protein n=1 Tax=Streptomyces sp. NPDC048518 TaxID=3155029 RepID=UPI0033EB74D9
MPPAPEAAEALRAWSDSADQNVTLDASGLDLSHADLSGTDLATSLLIETNLSNARLIGTDLYRANLALAVLDGADLTNSSLVKADIRDTSLQRADLTGANLGSAELWKVNARSTSLRNSVLDGAGFLQVELQGADLRGASARDTSFEVVLDDRTVVEGFSGSIFGPARVEEDGSLRVIAGLELELWLNDRGASIQVINSPVDSTTYFALVSDDYPRNNPMGLVRRRTAPRLGGGVNTSDEVFTRNLRWEPTEYLRLYELGHNDDDHVEISEPEANAFIKMVTRKNS